MKTNVIRGIDSVIYSVRGETVVPSEEKYPDAEKREIGFHVREEGGRYKVRTKKKR